MAVQSTQQLCLFVDVNFPARYEDSQEWAYGDATDKCLSIPPVGIAYLTVPDGIKPIVSTDPPDADEDAIVLETVRFNEQPYLAMMAAAQHAVRVNALAVGPVTILRVGDIVEIKEQSFHVSLYTSPYIGPPTEEHLESECGICRLKINDLPHMRIFVCPTCQRAMHFQDESASDEERLECAALVSECPTCQTPIVREEGFSYVPEIV